MNGQEQFIADIVGLYNEWAAVIGRPAARYAHKEAGQSKTCPEENFRILIASTISGSYRFFKSIGLPTDKIGRVGDINKPACYEFFTIECSYIKGLSEEQKERMKAMARSFIENDPVLNEMKSIKYYFRECDPYELLDYTVAVNEKDSLSISFELDQKGGRIASAIDASWSKISFFSEVNKSTHFDEDGNPQAYKYEFEVDGSRVPQLLAKIIAPLLAELAVLQFMSNIVKAYNQIAKHCGQKALRYEFRETREFDSASVEMFSRKYFMLQDNEQAVGFLKEIGVPVTKLLGEGFERIDYADISAMSVSSRMECISKARSRVAELCGETGLQKPDFALAVASAGLIAGGSGGAAAGTATKVASELLP